MEPKAQCAQPVDGISLASAYRLHATNFRMSAEILSRTTELRSDGTPARLTAIPFYFLISHAAELFLKAALLKRGFCEEDLRKPAYRHNLNALSQALQTKAVPITPHTLALINGMHSQHLSHALRYTVLVDNGGKTYWPPPFLLFEMLDELLLLTVVERGR